MSSFVLPSRLLVIGATGTIGKYITESILTAKPSFDHVAIFTSQQTVDTKGALLGKWRAGGLASVAVGDVTSDKDVARAYEAERPDTIILALGRGVLQIQTRLIELAEMADSVKWVFPSEYGTDIEHNSRSILEKPHQDKLALRKFIRENVRKVKVTYLVTGPYFDMWARIVGDAAAGGFNVAKKEAHLIDNGEGPIGFCTMPDVGKFLVASLRHPDTSSGETLRVQSFVVKPKDVLTEFETQTGEKWAVSSVSMADLEALETKMWANGNPSATPITLRRIWASGGTLYDKNDNELIGIGDADVDSLEVAVKRLLQ